jgi:hypothetical protein
MKMEPLIATPRPKTGESLLGYLLRVSESNGYPDPTWIMSHAGMTQNEIRSVRPPLSGLSQILQCSEKDLLKISYGKSDDRKKRSAQFYVNKHALHKVDLDIKRVRICPECVLEHGYIDAFWSLRLAIACPKHGRGAIQTCPSCNKPLSCYRKGILTCKCGYDFSKERSEESAPQGVKALLRILYNKLHHKPLLDDLTESQKFPLKEFEEISLRSLLCIIEKVRLRSSPENGRKKQSSSITLENLQKVAHYFSDWPNHFFDFIENTASKEELQNHIGLTRQFSAFTSTFLKDSHIPKSDIRFIQRTFIDFGETHWKKATIGSYKSRASIRQNIVGITGLAKHLNVEKNTAIRLIEMGLIRPIPQVKYATKKPLFDLSQEMPIKPKQGKSLGEREAALTLGIPVSVTKRMREIGEIKFRFIGSTLASFHQFDIEEYNGRLTSPVIKVKIKEGCISISDAMKMKVGNVDYKAKLLVAVANGEITPKGRINRFIGSIILNRVAVQDFYRNLKTKDSNTLLAKETARILGCDKEVPKSLVESGFLLGEFQPQGLRIYEDSVRVFAEKYIPCSKVAERLKTSSTSIINICKAYNCDLLQIGRGGKKSLQSFMPRSFLPTIGLEPDTPLQFNTLY